MEVACEQAHIVILQRLPGNPEDCQGCPCDGR
uniref:Uncharacterized protein n=1 Tax=Klebsiella phage PMBT70 TaxID=3229741 RepID=A0AB39C3Z9_9CAUD